MYVGVSLDLSYIISCSCVPLGEILSPWLFCVLVNGIVDNFDQRGLSVINADMFKIS